MNTPDLFLQERKAVSVLPATFIDRPYSYAVPAHMETQVAGSFVEISLNNRAVYGVVWDDEPDTGKPPPKKLKEIRQVFDIKPLSATHITFIKRVADYTLAPVGAVLKMSLSAPSAFEPEKPLRGYRIGISQEKNPAATAEKVIEALTQNARPMTAAALVKACGLSSAAPLKTLVKHGVIEQVDMFPPAPCRNPDPEKPQFDLSPAQNVAAQTLIKNIRKNSYTCSLLDGVTGSGKTEVYFEAVAEALKQGRQILILLPEIALSNAFIDRFEKRFGCPPALWHSALTMAQRRKTWRGVVTGETRVIMGARSALFLPYQNLGLIIVDEEHDPAYKQEDQVIYHARDMAVLRAHLEKIPICLVSATPSLETIQNAWEGRYQHLKIPQRFAGAHMPDIHILDMRIHKPPDSRHFIAEPLQLALKEALERGEQGLLFLNRRGYAPLTLCRTCGHRFECPRCSAWLTMHRHHQALLCHHCGHQMPQPETCPACGGEETLSPCGPGVERIAEELKEYFPDKTIEVLASDLSDQPDHFRAVLGRIRNGEIDLIVGTQMIAKGHHFPHLNCVGVIDADLGLDGGDLRATEKTYHLLHQVAGRAGREAKEEQAAGQVFIQTWMPENPVIQALAALQRDVFFAAELDARKQANMPPYSRLVSLIISGANESKTLALARLLAQAAPQNEGIQVLGPAAAPLSRLRDQYRFRLLVIASKTLHIQKTVHFWLASVKIPPAIRVTVDIDPQSFL